MRDDIIPVGSCWRVSYDDANRYHLGIVWQVRGLPEIVRDANCISARVRTNDESGSIIRHSSFVIRLVFAPTLHQMVFKSELIEDPPHRVIDEVAQCPRSCVKGRNWR